MLNLSKYTYRNLGILCYLLLVCATSTKASEQSFPAAILFSTIDVSHGLSDNQVRYMLQLSDGRMVFTTSGNVNLYDGSRFKYIHRRKENIVRLSNYDGYYRIYQGYDSLLWIKDYHNLMAIDLRTETYVISPKSYFEKKGFKGNIDDIFLDNHKRLWVLQRQDLIELKSGIKISIGAREGHLQDIVSAGANLYLFFNTGSVVCYNLPKKKITYKKYAYKKEDYSLYNRTSLVVSSADGIYQIRNGTKGGLFFFDMKKRLWKRLLLTDYTLNTLILKGNTAYVSCSTGLWQLNTQDGESEFIPTLKTVEGEDIKTEISTLFADTQGGLWLGTLNRGLLYHHPSRSKLSYIGRSYFSEQITDVLVEDFAEDLRGKIYVKTQKATYLYQHLSKNKHNLSIVLPSDIPHEVNKKFSSPRTSHLNAYETVKIVDSRGWHWTGTEDGLRLFIPTTNSEKVFYTTDGLINNYIHSILEDHNRTIWVTTSYGISHIKIDLEDERVHFSNYNVLSGALKEEYVRAAAFQSKNGILYFGGINGFNTFDPVLSQFPQLSYRPLLTNLYLKGEKVEVGKKYAEKIVLASTASYTTKIELLHHQNFVTFEFAGLNYQNPSQIYYRYKLIGIDAEWRETSSMGEYDGTAGNGLLRISYTDLTPGNYTLVVMSSANSLEWNGDSTTIDVVVLAPWWKTTIAYICYILFLVALAYCSMRFFLAQTKRKLQRQHKENILLIRIRGLIDQCAVLESERVSYSENVQKSDKELLVYAPENSAEAAFLSRAIAFVEKNLETPNYSVEQLSRDLNMDRTGLYRKLVNLLDKSPSLFIRNIRLQNAAKMITQGEYTISEIADRVGFSSASYFSKCFQELYGCKPSEYMSKSSNLK
ncbi:helix-turn-helix domain-containing protein [Sphingobacterium alkalisoli]|uniref:Helix-turn-helix domain-containing protein n=1 Tax=Sphingobacterium alkalisoli TaxID=1874115 RepID=A0A4U0GRC5_9SPHI|nr:helix-turn-helix domain-containing protein [Sphingobacterium alkalisoli]TJY61453.1 helix-turn-helix domain-containing protein [Sphingobacterium alkalisoli]GGH30306.1 transcriptional regulator [Sphingobacterium alkalisoli]